MEADTHNETEQKLLSEQLELEQIAKELGIELPRTDADDLRALQAAADALGIELP